MAVRLIVYSKGKNAKKYRKGEEYGSARWGTAKDIAPYIDPKFENNILLTQTERLTMTGRPKDPKTARNKNVLVIGGSGSGKTRFYVKPNLMQCFPTSDYPTSFVVTDPKGTLVLETGQMFQRAGYRVKILNTINFSKSMKYNPFVYIHSEKDVLKLVNTLIANTKGEGEKSAEDFWVKSERLFYTALIGYIWYEAPAEEMNFTTLLEMINASEAREDDPDFQSPVDLMFERLEQKDPDHFAVRQYKKFLLSAGKTRSSILISCGARLAPFDIREVRELMEDDEMELDTIGDEKTVLFLIMSDTDTTFNFILAMLQSQLTGIITVHNGKGGKDRLVPVHNSVIEYLRSYSAQLPDEREWFFPSACGHYSIKTIYDNFRELLFACNIPHTGNGPRVHDFRHTFAVHTLEKQLSDGYDPMVIVPRLAAYLGHKSYRETCWYIHLTVASFPELSQKLDRAFVGIIPVGGETDEEN